MEAMHNVCSVDLGSWTCKLAALNNQHRFQVLVNQANFRETPTVVAFSPAERLIGDQAVTKIKSNYMNTIRCPQRYIGLPKRPHLIPQQTQNLAVPYTLTPQSILFTMHQGPQILQLSAQSLTTALFTKFKQIYQANCLKTDFLFVGVRSYLSNGERKALKLCAEAAGFRSVGLVDQWEAIAAEYWFTRQKEIQAMVDQTVVVFVDFGYTNFSAHACKISRTSITLMDQQTLRYTGSKNLDTLLTQFYLSVFSSQTSISLSFSEQPKSIIKLEQAVEQQRKKLSANIENQLIIECILGDHDLSYNMKRQELENIAMPVFAEIASAMQSLRSRLGGVVGGVELIGGFGRMPFLQEVVKGVFDVEVSKKMNASQSVARGCAIAGANRLGLLRNCPTLPLHLPHPILLLSHSHPTQSPTHPLKSTPALYTTKTSLFSTTTPLPLSTKISIEGEGLNEVLVCMEKHDGLQVIGYASWKGSDTLIVMVDGDRIFRPVLGSNRVFQEFGFGDCVGVGGLARLRDVQDQMKKRDHDIIQSYQLRNQLQSLVYKTRQSLSTTLLPYTPKAQLQILLQILSENEQKLSQNMIGQNFNQRIETIQMLMQEPLKRQETHRKMLDLLDKIRNKISFVKKLHAKKPDVIAKISQVQARVQEMVKIQTDGCWAAGVLDQPVLRGILEEIDKIKG